MIQLFSLPLTLPDVELMFRLWSVIQVNGLMNLRPLLCIASLLFFETQPLLFFTLPVAQGRPRYINLGIHKPDLDNEANYEGYVGTDHDNDRNYVVTTAIHYQRTEDHYL